MIEQKTYICGCNAIFESDRAATPPGWVHLGDRLVCGDCAASEQKDEQPATQKAGPPADPLAKCETAILLRSGSYLDLADPDCSVIRPVDIAAGLRQPRFSAQTRAFYTIAQHSVMVAELIAPVAAEIGGPNGQMLRRCALLHDAPEAFLHDITRPLKCQLPDYKRIEARFETRFADAWGIRWTERLKALVKLADTQALAIEQRELFGRTDDWPCFDFIQRGKLANIGIDHCWPPKEAEDRFLIALANLENETLGEAA